MLETLIDKDIELLIFLNNLGTVQWDGFWLFITNKYSAIPLYVLLLILTFKTQGFKKTILVLLLIVLLILASDQTANLFKNGFQRLRPCHNEEILGLIRMVKKGCGGMYSFFSGHAINSMAVAVFFGNLLKRYKMLFPFLILWAVVVGYSRIYLAVHFPLDVLTGMFFGVLYGTFFYYFFRLIKLKLKL